MRSSCKIRARVVLHASGHDMQQRVTALVSDPWRRKDPLRAMRLVLEELTHRVNDEFAAAIRTVESVSALTQSDEVKSSLAAVQCRLENFARVHVALQAPEFRTTIDGGAYLRQLCEAISLSRLHFRGIQLELVTRRLDIDSEQCWRLGQVVSELVSNATRRSFLTPPTRIWVAAARRGALISCQVEDNGMASESESGSRGIRIVDALARELHGAFEQQQRGDHFVATVIFPAICESDRDLSVARFVR